MQMSLFLFCVPVGIRSVVAMLNAKCIVHFSLQSVEDPVWLLASAEGSFDVLIFLF